MMNVLAVIGAGGHGKVVTDAAIASGNWSKVICFDKVWPEKKKNGSLEITGNLNELLCFSIKPDVVVAIGNNKTRLIRQNELFEKGFNIVTVIHPASVISDNVMLGVGTVVMAGAIINSDSRVGPGCIVNSNAVIEHDCVLEAAVHISPGACLAGGVEIGEGSWIGLGASVIQEKRIGSNVVVGAGAVVIDDLANNVTAVGVPAKVVKIDGIIC